VRQPWGGLSGHAEVPGLVASVEEYRKILEETLALALGLPSVSSPARGDAPGTSLGPVPLPPEP